jgi:hypothetical protein
MLVAKETGMFQQFVVPQAKDYQPMVILQQVAVPPN